jgi:hypothetical protein
VVSFFHRFSSNLVYRCTMPFDNIWRTSGHVAWRSVAQRGIKLTKMCVFDHCGVIFQPILTKLGI